MHAEVGMRAGSVTGVQTCAMPIYAYGNDSTSGLGATKTVSIALTSGSGTLLGTTSINIGTGAATPGVATFTDLQINAAGSGKVLTASATSLNDAVSDSFTVAAATADPPGYTTPPRRATAGAGFRPQPG